MNEETIDLAGPRLPIRHLAGENLVLKLNILENGELATIADWTVEATIYANGIELKSTRENGQITDYDAHNVLWQVDAITLQPYIGQTLKYRIIIGLDQTTCVARGPFTFIKD